VATNDDLAPKKPFDVEVYAKRVRDGRCFVCAIVAGQSDYRHHIVCEDDQSIAFLNRYPTLLGYTLVAPKRHVEHLAVDLDVGEYLRLQTVVYQVTQGCFRRRPNGARLRSESRESARECSPALARRTATARGPLPRATVQRRDG
jgi:HIT domain-containing protein